MLRSHEPVHSLCLSFPRDNVSLLSPEREMYLDGCSSFDNNSHPTKSSAAASLRKLTRDQPLDRTNYDKFRVKRLVGSRDSSDRFAIHLKLDSSSLQQSSYRLPRRRHNQCNELILMVDSCRGEITQEVHNLNSGGLSPSISSYLDTMACFTTVDDEDEEEEKEEKQCISIYDVSRDYGVANSIRNNPYNSLSGKKRQYHSSSTHYSLTSDDDNCEEEEEEDGLLQKLCPKVHDAYGLQSSITCMTIDGYGETIACGTSDGDIFVCNCSDL
jgi:hypothetical protein